MDIKDRRIKVAVRTIIKFSKAYAKQKLQLYQFYYMNIDLIIFYR